MSYIVSGYRANINNNSFYINLCTTIGRVYIYFNDQTGISFDYICSGSNTILNVLNTTNYTINMVGNDYGRSVEIGNLNPNININYTVFACVGNVGIPSGFLGGFSTDNTNFYTPPSSFVGTPTTI